MLRGRQRPRPDPVHALVRAGRHAGGQGRAALRCARPDLPPGPHADAPADARPAGQAADGHSARVGLVGKDGGDLPLMLDGQPLDARRAGIDAAEPDFVVHRHRERPVPSLNRGFSAPIKLSLPIEPDDLRFLAAHDSDPFNRWQAVQTLAMSLLRRMSRRCAPARRCATTKA